MQIVKIITGKWKENCYLLFLNNNKVIAIDPGDEVDKIKVSLKNDSQLIAIFNTHAHYDHIGAVGELKNYYKCPFYLHSQDEKLLKSANLYKHLFDNKKPITIPKVDYYFDKTILPIIIDDYKIDVLHTPGHTKGGVCFLINNFLFTGDTLLKGKIGRTDLPGSNIDELKKTLVLLSSLPKQLVVLPGHGDGTNLGEEISKILLKGII